MKLTKGVKKALLVLSISIFVCVGIVSGWYYRNETVIPFFNFVKDIAYTILVKPIEPLKNMVSVP